MSDVPFIALIEDEEHLAEALLFNLEAEGYRVHHEADGEAALEWLLNTPERPRAVSSGRDAAPASTASRLRGGCAKPATTCRS